MDMIFEYLQQDLNVMLALLGVSSTIAVAALWKVIADLLRKPDAEAPAAASEPVTDPDSSSQPHP